VQSIQRLLNHAQFLLHVADRLSIAVSLLHVRAQQFKEKLVADSELLSLTGDRDLLYEAWAYPVFYTERRLKLLCNPSRAELASHRKVGDLQTSAVTRVSIKNQSSMIGHALL
jgi:hypothetical protein